MSSSKILHELEDVATFIQSIRVLALVAVVCVFVGVVIGAVLCCGNAPVDLKRLDAGQRRDVALSYLANKANRASASIVLCVSDRRHMDMVDPITKKPMVAHLSEE